MAHDPEEYCRLRREFIEAAVKYEPAGYFTFIQRTTRSEEGYYESGRYEFVAYITWPYKPWRKCMILAPVSGTNEDPFSTMKTLFSKAWLWLPRVIAEAVVDRAEKHLSPPAEFGLYWARSHHQLWGWLLWFDWLWRCGEVETGEPEVPPAGMDLPPFSYSADLIARWGLDGSAGTIPVWLAEFVIERKGADTGSNVGRPGGITTEPAGPAANASEAAAIEVGVSPHEVAFAVEQANRNQTLVSSDFERELQNALETQGIRMDIAEALSLEQKRNIIMAHWATCEGLTTAKVRNKWKENGWPPSLGSESKTKLANKVKAYIKRGQTKLDSLARQE